jgi:AraC family transcriptional activator of pobA
MDGPPRDRYFSTMPSRRTGGGTRPAPPSIAFNRTKYGRELLVDAAMVPELPGFDRTERPHRLDFFDILLVTRGRGEFRLDQRVERVAPGVVLFSRPGEVRQWRVPALDGAVLFFAPGFLTDAFSDPRFLDQFACFHPKRPSAAVRLTAKERGTFRARFAEMGPEIRTAPGDGAHALRALTYELLVLLDRAYVRAHGAPPGAGRDQLVDRFRTLVEQRFARAHRVTDYAQALGVTARYLNDRCRAAHEGRAKDIVQQRLALESRRLLLYTDLPVLRIGAGLGFPDPAYFARFFRRETGLSPSEYRASRTGR